jgi:hypothetical protein
LALTGLDGVRLPHDDARAFFLVGWDAGRENNTERQQDIVEPCSVLGPVVLVGVHSSPNHDTGPASPPSRLSSSTYSLASRALAN